MKYQQLKLFREEEGGVIPRETIVPITSEERICLEGDHCIEARGYGNFRGLAVFLPTSFDYILGADETGAKILVVLRLSEHRE